MQEMGIYNYFLGGNKKEVIDTKMKQKKEASSKSLSKKMYSGKSKVFSDTFNIV